MPGLPARNRKLSPIHDRIAALGAQFNAYNGWERATWYAKPGDDVSEESTQTFRRDGPWEKRVREECLAVRDAAGILDLPGFSRFRLYGPGARAWLSTMITGLVPKPGRIGLGYFADDKGRIVTEMSIVAHRRRLLRADHGGGGAVARLRVASEASAARHGFDSRRCDREPDLPDPRRTEFAEIILAEVCDADLSLPWLSHQSTEIAGRWCQLVRVSFAGELGWEIHTKVGDTATIFDAVWAAGQKHGLKPFGMFALDSLRLEKGYRAWKGDLSTDYTILQGGLERFVKWDKPEFQGQGCAAEREAAGREEALRDAGRRCRRFRRALHVDALA